MWSGFSNRRISESTHFESEYFNGMQNIPFNIKEYINYDQTSFNINGGVNYSKSFGNFELNSGLELSYLHTGKGLQIYNGWQTEYANGELLDSTGISQTVNIAPGNSYGIGFYLGAEYNFLTHFSVGAEFHQFLFYSIFNNETNVEETYSFSSMGQPLYESSESSTIEEDFKQFSFSSILPVIELRYKF